MSVPVLCDVQPGRGPAELVLLTDDARAILLRGDGLTDEEHVAMAARALPVLRAVITEARLCRREHIPGVRDGAR